uniref:Cell cycle regulator of non-homologous end joining n=1 Tax=Danio rerio TaxID=7955 RepID=A0A0R4IQP0_DANRE|nr:uncharacterized protein si:ch211-127m7.2 [Danio rerio]|eukprot:XP_001341792.1 uncharacterized protein si:ch211-127m7.2 [Danio rerio]
MSEKHRNLPQWMVKTNDKDAEKKKTHETTKRTAKKRLKSVVAYWMNERELLETALDILKDETKMSRDAVQAPEEEEDEVKVIPETDDEDSTDLHHSTRVSNIAEQETVPYENCVEEKTNTKPDCHLKPNSDVSEPPEKPDEDDEALKLVREIFFT